jgi:hypothetical protein
MLALNPSVQNEKNKFPNFFPNEAELSVVTVAAPILNNDAPLLILENHSMQHNARAINCDEKTIRTILVTSVILSGCAACAVLIASVFLFSR